MKDKVDELFDEIHNIFEEQDGGCVYLTSERENRIKQLLKDVIYKKKVKINTDIRQLYKNKTGFNSDVEIGSLGVVYHDEHYVKYLEEKINKHNNG